jgi:hypothetical protein
MFTYRYIPKVSLDELPSIPFISFASANVLTRTYHDIDLLEEQWNKNQSLVFSVRYAGSRLLQFNTYYFILPSTQYISDTDEYRRLALEEIFDIRDDEVDYVAKLMLLSIMRNLTTRIQTRNAIQNLQQSFPYSPDESIYHELLLQGLTDMSHNEQYDPVLLKHHIREETDIVETERHYRPGAPGFKDVQTDFEELAFLMKLL